MPNCYRLCCCLFLLLSGLQLAAQSKAEVVDEIRMTSGHVYRGYLITYQPGEYVKLLTTQGDTLEIPAENIQQIVQQRGQNGPRYVEIEREVESPTGDALSADEFREIVRLKDGTVYIGRIVEFKKEEYLTFQTVDGYTYTFAAEEIAGIDYRLPEKPREREERERTPADLLGWYNHSDFGFSFAKGPSGFGVVVDNGIFPDVEDSRRRVGISVNHTLGYQWKNWLGLGLSVGYDNYYVSLGEAVVSVAAEYRAYFGRTKVAPYLTGQVGYGKALRNKAYQVEKAEGGLLVHPAIGLLFDAGAKVHFTTDLGYRFQRARFERISGFSGDYEIRTINYRRLMLRFGVLF